MNNIQTVLRDLREEGHPWRTLKRKLVETLRHWRHDPAGTVRLLQNETEFTALKRVIQSKNPRKILEIGSLYGGTLKEWMKTVTRGALLVSIDLPVHRRHRAYEAQAWGHYLGWETWGRQFGHRIIVFSTPSTDYSTHQQVAILAPFDFLFIDGGHDYETVRSDFENYAGMVNSGGVIALHDIEGAPGVKKLWDEVKHKGSSYSEFVDIYVKHQRGIGVIHW